MADGTMPDKKVVVTGIGAVSAIGSGKDFFPNLMSGKLGVSKLPDWAEEFQCKIGGTVTDFEATDWYGNKKEAKRQSRYSSGSM
jgi:3-oxoacyl-[acyl-carrier-protein] synthase II